MRIAVFSDVHGNLTALEAVLADIAQRRPDATCFAGDLCLFGARPAETLRRLAHESHILSVSGNADIDLLEATLGASEHVADDDFQRSSARWAAARLSGDDVRFLDAMTFSQRLSPTGSSHDDLVVCHANPTDHHTFIAPAEDEQRERLGKVVLPHDEAQIDRLLDGVQAGAVAFGHFHFPNTQRAGDTLLVNASSVSNPMDLDPRAKYALLEWSSESLTWSATVIRVPYDRTAEHDALERHRPPNWQLLARILDGELYLG